MTEKDLRTLFQFGFLTKSEQEKLLAKFKVDGLSPALKNDIAIALEEQMKSLEKEEKEFEKREKELDKSIKDLDLSIKKEISEKYERLGAERREKIWQRKKRKAQAMNDIFAEIERFERNLDGMSGKIERKVEEKRLADIRKRLR